MAMTAAAIFPMMGLIGAAVDMGRVYAVKSRLQAGCDAGALAGRRTMGTGQWSDNSGLANTVALKTFDLNFPSGTFGSDAPTRSFTESDGTVTGTATVAVPMTLMRLFDKPTKTITVTCDGQMRIPNTDVMFVLDNSGSMSQVIPGDTTGRTKIVGLRLAIKCFYEALAKRNIDDVTHDECGTDADPSGGLSSQVQLRFGFVNYDHMVNVGKLLPNDYMVDSATYQSRVANTEQVWAWTLGTATTPNYGAWSATPDGYSDPSSYGSTYTVVSAANTTLADLLSYPKQNTSVNSATCDLLNQYGSHNKLVGITESYGTPATPTYTPSDNDPPVYPATAQNQNVSRTRTTTVSKGFRYRWFKNGSTTSCWLESANANTASNAHKYTQTQTGTASKPINWTPYNRIVDWTYKPVTFTVSSLKLGDSSWGSSVSLPIGQSSATSVKLSGSNTSTSIRQVANTSVAWNGCIEERHTFKNTDGDGSDDWPIGWTNNPSTPGDATDMDIKMTPSIADDNTRWKPALHAAVWGRQTTLDSSGNWSGGWTHNNVTGAISSNRNLSSNSCVAASRKLAAYPDDAGAANFKAYINSLTPNGNTYHDIGLLWGARLMWPDGIFRSENETTPGGAQITRHMIFMTDGDTANTPNNYTSYGIDWWDQRQFNTDVTAAQMEANNNARSKALCKAIKNKNITLWVISYGNGANVDTNNRLKECSSGDAYFFSAADTTQLIKKFREIADRIANLRLTG
ncbi:pilus assembly protein TadG-related protein [Sphingobium subterraneum]|uniref:Flp pilus assembly protein TadG n=1 Tax=Sphingobium subterraneum TaxID=627688 RepID=A0A841IVV5_9SPHN|nr:pilus assembly protein TadG-related protein [Sphingobium subterraneum]MBB6122474.1 Flp pilus assembly protein TadG [Sphingobium subterraneum]